jgi:uncharacterized membrane protein YeaQ/YmgE (transglycosylase-associated protein family)
MGVLGWILLGAIAGWLANVLAGRNQRSGCLANIAVGIIGAIFRGLGGSGVTGFNLWSLLVAVIGAIVLLAILELFRR